MSPQRIDAGAGLADVSGQHRQIGVGDDVIRAVAVFAHTHGVYNHRRAVGRIHAGCLDYEVGIHAGNPGHLVQWVVLEVFPEGIEVFTSGFDKGGIVQPFIDDDAAYAHEQGDIGADTGAYPQVGITHEVGLHGVDDNKPGSPLPYRLAYFHGQYRMGLRGIGADS